MHHLNADLQALAQFLASLRLDWNLGRIPTELDRPELSSLQWPDLVVTAVRFAADEDHSDPRHETGPLGAPEASSDRHHHTAPRTRPEASHDR